MIWLVYLLGLAIFVVGIVGLSKQIPSIGITTKNRAMLAMAGGLFVAFYGCGVGLNSWSEGLAERDRAREVAVATAPENTLDSDPPQPQKPNPKPELKPEPKPAAQRVPQKPTIPGLAAVDIYGNFRDRGFTCVGPKGPVSDDPDRMIWWECADESNSHSFTVEVFAYSPTRIISVEAWSASLTGSGATALAKPFLGFAASLPYDGSSPAEARAWVESNVGRETRRQFGGVQYQLNSKAQVRWLRITPFGVD